MSVEDVETSDPSEGEARVGKEEKACYVESVGFLDPVMPTPDGKLDEMKLSDEFVTLSARGRC